MSFSHEKLRFYQNSVQFVRWTSLLLGELTTKGAVKDQLDRASTSVVLNIAEGNGKFSKRDRIRFLQIANGSALECAASLDVMIARGMTDEGRIEEGKTLLHSIVNQLYGLMRSLDPSVVQEEQADYGTDLGVVK